MRKTIVTKALCLVQIAGIGLTASVLPLFGMIEPAKAQTAPSCVTHSIGTDHRVVRGRIAIFRRRAIVTNNCGDRQRVKVIWAFAPDSACTTLGPRESFSSRAVGRQSRFDGLRRC